jgi:hypothetical protein
MHGRRLRIDVRSDLFSILFGCLNALCTNLRALRPCRIHNLTDKHYLTPRNRLQARHSDLGLYNLTDANDSQLHFYSPPFVFRISVLYGWNTTLLFYIKDRDMIK